MHKFGILRFVRTSHGMDYYMLPVVDAASDIIAASVETRLEDLTETLVELLTVYDIESLDDMHRLAPPMVTLPVSNDWDVLHVDYHEDHNGKEEYSAGVIDGDTGAMQLGYGASVLDAVADLARNLDFHSKIADHHLTLRAFLDSVHYGLNRRSDEILMEELEGVLVPEKGGW